MVKITKTVASERLGDVPSEKRFWCYDGKALKNLSELEEALQQMSEETFRFHSSEGRSDFSNWVMNVVGDEKLSRDLQKSTTRIQAAKSVASRVAWLKSKAEAG